MGLEKTVAEIEVLADEITRRATLAWTKDRTVSYKTFDHIRRNLLGDPFMIMDKYSRAKAALSGRDVDEASNCLTEFCLDVKNLADSVNLLAQIVYGTEKPKLTKLGVNTVNAPRTADGRTIVEVMAVHDHSKTSVNNTLRNMKGHGKGHSALVPSDKGYRIVIEGENGPLQSPGYADEWLDAQIRDYLDMAKVVLETISDNGKGRLASGRVPLADVGLSNGRYDIKRKSVTVQRLKNWKKRHERPVKVALASALIAAGVVGTLAYQNISEKQREIRQGNEIRNIIAAGYLDSTENWARGVAEKTFSQAHSGIVERTRYVGRELINTVNSNQALKEAMGPDYRIFEKEWRLFNERLSNLKYDSSSSSKTIQSLAELSNLLRDEQFLIESDKKLTYKVWAVTRGGITAKK